MKVEHRQIISRLKQKEPTELDKLFIEADRVRRENVGDEIHLRGLIEFSNVCSRRCSYCGINASNSKIERYQMSKEEIVECAQTAKELGYGTVVLQSGENRKLDTGLLAETIREIKNTTGLAVTLSVGQWDAETYKMWKDAGADRFLLRFETSDDELYRKLHPDSKEGAAERFEALKLLKNIGYEAGSGVMIGLPGQSYETLANDLLKFQELDLDMIGVGPYIKHNDTKLVADIDKFLLDDKNQVPASEEMTYKVYAIARILCPKTNIPATTALATMNPESGYEKALACGCNVIMPNITPMKYRQHYNLYEGKTCRQLFEFDMTIRQRIEKINRTAGNGKGVSLKFAERTKSEAKL
ncbi:MAG: [FeFe] hydrogenase H-cluster radical SAM maturase HydE [Planctomycetaceae bacterium]|nr:[FeFe] hydrogenase H-cluster radical SAM maturase HydE [Planctomycetaceae bacterium]